MEKITSDYDEIYLPFYTFFYGILERLYIVFSQLWLTSEGSKMTISDMGESHHYVRRYALDIKRLYLVVGESVKMG